MTERAVKKLKELKENSRKTIEQIVEESGVSKSTVIRAMNGETVSMYSLNKIVGALDYDVEKFVEETTGIGYVPQPMVVDLLHEKDKELEIKNRWIAILFCVSLVFIITSIVFASFAFVG